MNYLILFACSFVSSIVTMVVMYLTSARGTLRIDHSNPEKDVYRIEINDLDALSRKKKVILDVDNSAILSQE